MCFSPLSPYHYLSLTDVCRQCSDFTKDIRMETSNALRCPALLFYIKRNILTSQLFSEIYFLPLHSLWRAYILPKMLNKMCLGDFLFYAFFFALQEVKKANVKVKSTLKVSFELTEQCNVCQMYHYWRWSKWSKLLPSKWDGKYVLLF